MESTEIPKDELEKAGIDSLYFNSFLHDAKWLDKTLSIYEKAFSLIKAKRFDNEAKASLINEITHKPRGYFKGS